MASLAVGSLCKKTSIYYSRVAKSSSSLATVSKPQACNFDKKNSTTFQQKPCKYHMAQNFYTQFTPLVKHKKKFQLDAASSDNPRSDVVHDLMGPMETTIGFLGVLYRFIRPYAAVGTGLNVASMSLLAVDQLSDFSQLFFMKALQALLGGLFMQMYVCGFNQICDIELDKWVLVEEDEKEVSIETYWREKSGAGEISASDYYVKVNKPFLPLAAGELSMRTAIIVSSFSAIMSFSIARIVGSIPLFWGFVGWFVVGTAYSANVLPLLRWKRFPLTAAFYMLMARALVVPVAYYTHMQNSLHGRTILLSRPTVFAVGMLSVFSLTTIFFKDIPDLEGDQMHGIKSLASRLGLTRMFWSCIWLLEMAYVAAAFVGITSSVTWSKYVTVIGYLVMASLLWIRAKSTDIKSKEAVQPMYMFLWQLFYAEYCLIPFVR